MDELLIKFGLYAILARPGTRADWAAVEETWTFEGRAAE
jgi:hypothetical protein